MNVQPVWGLLAGVPIGFQLGATGAGGALLAVPLLVYIAGVSVREAVTISLVVVATASFFGAWDHARRGAVKLPAVAAFGVPGMIGAWGGAMAHRLVPAEVLLILFGALLLAARAVMVWQARREAVPVSESVGCAVRFPRSCWLRMGGIGLGVGVLNGFFGVGGGFLIVPALVVLLKFPNRLAIGTSLSIIAINATTGILSHLQFAAFDGHLAMVVGIGSLAGILLGTHAGEVVGPTTMSRLTASVTVSLSLWLMIVNSIKLLGVSW